MPKSVPSRKIAAEAPKFAQNRVLNADFGAHFWPTPPSRPRTARRRPPGRPPIETAQSSPPRRFPTQITPLRPRIDSKRPQHQPESTQNIPGPTSTPTHPPIDRCPPRRCPKPKPTPRSNNMFTEAYLAKFGPTLAHIDHMLKTSAKCGPKLAKFQPLTSGRCWSNLADVDQVRSMLARVLLNWPMCANVWPTLAKHSKTWANNDRIWSKAARN